MFEGLWDILLYILGALSNDIYVNVSGEDHINCGSITKPCRSLSFTINNISSHNDKIYLTASPINQVSYILQNPVVIKHSLTVTKFPANSQNPVITHYFNVTSNLKEIYTFVIYRYVVAPEALTLDIKSVNFNVNILTTFSEGCKALQKSVVVGNISGFELSISISDSIISSPCHAISLTDISRYENVTIHMKNLVVENGNFLFQTRSEKCEHMKYIKNTVGMDNVRISNTGKVALSVNGCFNVSIEKLMCSNFTWKGKKLFTFKGGVLNTKNVLIDNVFTDSNMKHNNSKKKALFLISEGIAKIQNMLIKNNSDIRPQGSSTLIIIENSEVKILDVEMEGNYFRNLARAHKSFLYVENMTVSGNNLEGALWTVEESNLMLNETKFYRNKFGRLTNINLNSKVIITSSSVIGNEIYEYAYHVGRSDMELNNIKFYNNKINILLLAKLQSHILINNLKFTNNDMTGRKNIIFRKCTMKMYNADISRNKFNYIFLSMESNSSALIKNISLTDNTIIREAQFAAGFSQGTTFSVRESSALELINVKFIRNRLLWLLFIHYNSSALIQNNTLAENNFSRTRYYLYVNSAIRLINSAIQLINVKFIRNRFEKLLNINNKSSALIQYNTLTENNVSWTGYYLDENSAMQLINVKFIRNRFKVLLNINNNSSALIQNNILTENHDSWGTYDLYKNCAIQLINVKFIRNRFFQLLVIKNNSSALIQNNILTENHVLSEGYSLYENCAIQLINVKFIRNRFSKLLLIENNSSALVQNNTLTENHVLSEGYDLYENCAIQLINVKFIRNRFGMLLYINNNSSALIQNNTLTENNVSWRGYTLYKNSAIQLSNVKFIRNRFGSLLNIYYNSSAIIQNNIPTENEVSSTVYYISLYSTIQLNGVSLIENSLKGRLLDMDRNCSAKLINNTVVENNGLGQVFFAHSSYLGIHTIRIESNTFSQLIWVVECKASFESMRIRENNVANGMIYIENTDGKMINTYIKNCDSSMASAFTITCTYLGNKYYPFEISNVEITWSYKLQTSARPIIQLSGKVSLSNVKLLVTSFSEIEVLSYSTKDVRLRRDAKSLAGVLETFSHVYYVISSSIVCTKAKVEYVEKATTFRCIPCERSTYTLNNGFLELSTSIQSNKTIMPKNVTNVRCLDCPVGANCAASIKSKSNFYGYETKEQQLKSLSCPKGFCCSGSQCNTTKSCNKNRVGNLCGRCIDDYMESFISTSCIAIHSCQNFGIFWLVYCTYALILATFLYYINDFISWIKTVGSIIYKIFQPCLKEKESEGEIDVTIGIAEAEVNFDEISHFTVSGILNLIVSFYQIKQLMSVDVEYKISSNFSFITFISDFLNLEMIAVTYSSHCPMSNLDAVSKIFIKTYLLTAALLIASLINYFMSRVFHYFRPSLRRGSFFFF